MIAPTRTRPSPREIATVVGLFVIVIAVWWFRPSSIALLGMIVACGSSAISYEIRALRCSIEQHTVILARTPDR